MTIEKKSVSLCVVELAVKAEKPEYKEAYDSVEKSYLKNASLPGFRKGKVPPALIRSKFAASIKQDAVEAIAKKLAPKAIEEEKLEHIAVTGMKDPVLSDDSFSCTFTVEIKPVFDVPKYKGLKVEKIDTTISEKQIDDHVDSYRKMYAKYDEAGDDAVVSTDDFVTISFKGVMKDKAKTPVKDLVPEDVAKTLAERDTFWVRAGEEECPMPEISKAVLGMKKGETKEDVEVKFGDNVDKAIAGKKALYTVTVSSFRKCTYPTDEEIIKDIPDVNTIDEFRASVRKAMEENAAAQAKQVREESALEALLKAKGADFEIPPSQVYDAQMSILRDYVERARKNGMTDADIAAKQEEVWANAKTFAEKQVRIAYILGAIAEKEKIDATDEEIAEFVKANNKDDKVSVEDIMKQIKANGRINSVKSYVVNQKIIALLLDNAK